MFSSPPKPGFKGVSLGRIMQRLTTFQYREALTISCAKSGLMVVGKLLSMVADADDRENETGGHVLVAKAFSCISYP